MDDLKICDVEQHCHVISFEAAKTALAIFGENCPDDWEPRVKSIATALDHYYKAAYKQLVAMNSSSES